MVNKAKTPLEDTIGQLVPGAEAPPLVSRPPEPAPEPPTKKIRYRGRESNLHLAHQAQNSWVQLVESGTPYEAVLQPDYWAAYSKKFRPYDRIEVRVEDGSWIAWLRVIDSGLNWTKIVPEREPLLLGDSPSDKAVPIDGHLVRWNGPIDKWSVIRDSDRAKLQAGFESRAAALVWLTGHLKALAA